VFMRGAELQTVPGEKTGVGHCLCSQITGREATLSEDARAPEGVVPATPEAVAEVLCAQPGKRAAPEAAAAVEV